MCRLSPWMTLQMSIQRMNECTRWTISTLYKKSVHPWSRGSSVPAAFVQRLWFFGLWLYFIPSVPNSLFFFLAESKFNQGSGQKWHRKCPRYLKKCPHSEMDISQYSRLYTTGVMFLKEVSSAHQGCIYLIKNTGKTVKLWNIFYNLKELFSVWISVKMQFIAVLKSCIFSIITPVFSVTWFLKNHSNMLICCSRNISDYNQYWKQLCCPIFLWKLWYVEMFGVSEI